MADNTLPLVTVIIPTYNRANLAIEAVESVLNQTYTHVEVIVVDDGSTDNTREVINAIPDDRVRYIYQDNARQAAARNNGMRAARGEYIAFLDSDDLFLPEKLAKQVDYLQKHPQIDFLYTGYIKAIEEANERREYPATLFGQPVFEILLRTEIATPSVIMTRAAIDKAGYFDETLPGVEDLEYWARVAKHVEIASLPEPTIEIRVNSFNPNRFVRRRLNNTLIALETVFRDNPNLSWLERRKLYANAYFVALAQLYDMFPDYPDDVNQRFIVGTVAKLCLNYPLPERYRQTILRSLWRTLLPRNIYMRLRPLWRRVFVG